MLFLEQRKTMANHSQSTGGTDPEQKARTVAPVPRPRVRFDRNEFSGAFGDIGTDLPLLLAMIPAAGLDVGSVFLLFGLAQVVTGMLYGLPMPMQPLKAMAVMVIAEKIPGNVLLGGGLAIGVVMLGLTVSGLLQWLVRVIPRCVVRGVQLGLALSLGQMALRQYVPAMGPKGFVLAGVSFVILLLLLGNRRVPAALPVIGLGVLVALLSGIDTEAIAAGVGFHLPSIRVPAWSDVVTGFLLLALPQLPLSLSNSVIATHRTLGDLFPERPVSVRKIGATYSLVNLAVPFLGGVPLCHGCGGLAGHHAFGGRTGGSVVIYGGLFLLIGLFFGGAASEVVRLFPLPVLGVILFSEAVALGSLVRDVAESRREFLIVLIVALCALGLPQGYVVGMFLGTALYYGSVRQRGAGTTSEGEREGPAPGDHP